MERTRSRPSSRALAEWLEYFREAWETGRHDQSRFLRLVTRNRAPCWENPYSPDHPLHESLDARGPLAPDVETIVGSLLASPQADRAAPDEAALHEAMRRWLACVHDGSIDPSGMPDIHRDNLLIATLLSARSMGTDPERTAAGAVASGMIEAGAEADAIASALRLSRDLVGRPRLG